MQHQSSADRRDVHPEVAAGDPFIAASLGDYSCYCTDAETPHEASEATHACYSGVVYIGHMVEDPETGAEVEVIDCVPCRRCAH